jgi:hypothetical protein
VKRILILFAALAVSAAVPVARADEPFLKPNDVIALVGGEDMIVAGEYGYLEAQLLLSFPDFHLKVRSLAWEGDTVFEQPRMLNYPSIEAQLDEIGATVVIMQFGQMESMAGESGLSEFSAAYGKLIERIRGSKRRIVLVEPTPILARSEKYSSRIVNAYAAAVSDLSTRASNLTFVSLTKLGELTHRDGRHLNFLGQMELAREIGNSLGAPGMKTGTLDRAAHRSLISDISKKMSLWDRYRRPQNWAFLAGDRITQASSRDHIDPKKRWFPEEMKEFIPLIEAREREIWDLTAKLAAEKQ